MTDIQRLELCARKIVNRFVQKCKNPTLSPVCLAIEYWNMYDHLKWFYGFVPPMFGCEKRIPERVQEQIVCMWEEMKRE